MRTFDEDGIDEPEPEVIEDVEKFVETAQARDSRLQAIAFLSKGAAKRVKHRAKMAEKAAAREARRVELEAGRGEKFRAAAVAAETKRLIAGATTPAMRSAQKLASRKAAKKRWREGLKAKGLCKCGKEPRPNRKSCAKCGAKAVKREKKRMKRNWDAGLCKCGRDPRHELKTCFKCGEVANNRSRRNATTKRKAGLCVRPGCKVKTGGPVRCEKHAAEHADRYGG